MDRWNILQLRTDMGSAFIKVTLGHEKEVFSDVKAGWLVLSGLATNPLHNKGCIHTLDSFLLAKMIKSVESVVSPTRLFLAGEAKALRMLPDWKRLNSFPLMAMDLTAELTWAPDPRVYTATSIDYERILKCCAEAFNTTLEFQRFSSYGIAAKNVESDPDLKIWLIDDGDDISSIVYAYRCGESVGLLAMGTVPHHRRKGHGRAILQACLLDAKSTGAKHSILTTTPIGLLLYSSVGYVEVEEWDQYERNTTGIPLPV